MGTLDEGSKSSTFKQLRPDYPWLGDSSVTVTGSTFRRVRDVTRQGDKRTPLPYYHSVMTRTGSKDFDHWKYDWGVNGYALYHNVQYSASAYVDSPVYNTYFSLYNDKLITNGPYAESNNKALGKLNKEKFDIGSALAEIMETGSHFASRAGLLLEFCIAVKQRKWRKALRRIGISKRNFNSSKAIAKNSASLYLEYQFAIRPVIKDVGDLVKLHKDGLSDLPTIYLAVKGKVEEQIDTETVTGQPFQSEEISTTVKGMRIMNTKLYCIVSDFEKIAQKGLGIDSIVPGLWEFLPFSWLVDYAVDVGGLIDAWTGPKGLTFISGYNSTKLICEAKKTTRRDDSSLLPDYVGHVYKYKYVSTDRCNGYTRQIFDTFPVPTLRWVLPDLNSGQAANVFALATLLSLK